MPKKKTIEELLVEQEKLEEEIIPDQNYKRDELVHEREALIPECCICQLKNGPLIRSKNGPLLSPL